MAKKKVEISNIHQCLKVINDFIKEVPDSKDVKINFKSLNEKKAKAKTALEFLTKLTGKGPKMEDVSGCIPRHGWVP